MNTAISETLLLGPGPCNISESVRDALSRPLLGHLDPSFLEIMESTKTQLRQVFKTKNKVTFPISATGSAGMEFLLVNFLEAGDKIVVGVNGVFGGRVASLAEKLGAKVIRVEQEWGRAVDTGAFCEVVKRESPKIAALVNGETSTGVYQPMDGVGEACHEAGALLFVDCVTSLAGMPVDIDGWGADLVFSGTQKCLGVPPGLAPVTVSDRALDVYRSRSKPTPSFYFDLNAILAYIDGEGGRSYHHTAPISMVFALDAGLKEILADGLEARWERHANAAAYLRSEMAAFGFTPVVPEGERLNPLTTLYFPQGFEEAKIRSQLLVEHQIEVGAGLGPLAGKIWRIGLMGGNAQEASVDRLIEALKRILN
jgi:alanine-glyoxylate transaminase / serine-glyoxylate transaminase / serine-pyruvate transaminase